VAARIDELFYQHIDGTMELVSPENDVIARTKWGKAVELSLRGFDTPLRIMDPEGVAASVGAQFKDIFDGAVVMQIIVTPDRPRRPTANDKEKVDEHTFNVIIRLGATGDNAEGKLRDLYSVFHSVESHGAKFTARRIMDASGRINRRAATWGFNVLLNARELSAFPWPLDGSGQRRAKRLPPTPEHDTEGIVLGNSNAPKMNGRPIAMPIEAGDMHMRVLGGSGVGKSNFLLNLCIQYMERTDTALILIEPAGDLAEQALHCVPAHRVQDVIYYDLRDGEFPIGLNPLSGDDPERITGNMIGILKTRSGDSWSPTIQRVSTVAIETAAVLKLTAYDVRRLLVSKEYRQDVFKALPRSKFPQLREEWDWVESRTDFVVDSSVNRIDQSFTGSRIMRNVLSQAEGLDFDMIIREHKILLVPLPTAMLGQINASAIGSIIREMAWTAARRQPMHDRQRSVVIMDEYQNYAGESLMSKSDPFAEARKYKQQYIIANQFQEQLPRDVQLTVDKNVATQIVFRLAPEEAARVKARYAPLSDEDLTNLPRYTVAARVMSSGGLAPTVTFKTAPPPPETPYWGQIIERTRKLYARPRAEVEADIMARHKSPEPKKRPKIGEMDL
jgi:DNA helicase HerA-like ATPase